MSPAVELTEPQHYEDSLDESGSLAELQARVATKSIHEIVRSSPLVELQCKLADDPKLANQADEMGQTPLHIACSEVCAFTFCFIFLCIIIIIISVCCQLSFHVLKGARTA